MSNASEAQRSRPCYFGPADRPLFGMVHLPKAAWTGTRVLFCAPLGYEGLFAHITLHDLAKSVAEAAAAVVMTFDYDGSGDSAGSDEDPDRVPLALASIDHAIDHLKSLSETGGPLLIIGLRAGALLAAYAASKRDDVTAIALWAPCVSGKLFLREHRVFSQLSETNPPAPPGVGKTFGERGFEANGYVFTDATVEALEALNLKTLADPPAPRILLLHRSDMPGGLKPPAGWARASIEQLTAPGYAEMVEPPWLWTSPLEAIQTLSDWARRVAGPPEGPKAVLRDPGRDVAVLPGQIEERPVWFGPGGCRFGILTQPAEGDRDQVAIMVASTYAYRIGPNRLSVTLARRLAAVGIASFRFDVQGVGDSRDTPGRPPAGPYDLTGVEDVLCAIHHLVAAGYKRISLAGICASAFLAWQAAIRADRPVNAVLINQVSFEPIAYDRERHMHWIGGGGAAAARYNPEADLANKARWALGRARRAAQIGGIILVGSLPSRLRLSELPGQLVELGRRRSRVSLIFSRGDAGMVVYRRKTGLQHWRLRHQGIVSIRVIDGPDHSFTPRWAVDLLGGVVCDEVAAWSPQR